MPQMFHLEGKNMRKVISAIALSGAILATLTACDPPMPDSLLVELAERTVVCPETAVDVAVTESVLDVSSFWNDSLTNACGVSLNLLEETAGDSRGGVHPFYNYEVAGLVISYLEAIALK